MVADIFSIMAVAAPDTCQLSDRQDSAQVESWGITWQRTVLQEKHLEGMSGRIPGWLCRSYCTVFCFAAIVWIRWQTLFFPSDGRRGGHVWSSFTNVLAVLMIIAAIALSAVCIYNLDKRILGKTELEPEQIKRAAISLALFTAPYLYLVPSRWFYW